MWHFLLGFGVGIYLGTYYNCKPQLDNFVKLINKSFPERKNDK